MTASQYEDILKKVEVKSCLVKQACPVWPELARQSFRVIGELMGKQLESKLVIISFILLVFMGCQSFSAGEDLPLLQAEYRQSGVMDLSTPALYKYYQMCRAAWRPRISWMDSGWRLIYLNNPVTETQWLMIPEEETVYIIFRSSRALQQDSVDFYYNRRFLLKPIPFMANTRIRAHKGFIEKYMSIRQWFMLELDSFNPENIILIGHSAGAAMASLAFIDLKTLYPDSSLNLITFGMTRTFNKKGAEWYQTYRENVIRIVNGRDFFPSIPPQMWGYRHIGRLICIGERPFWQFWSMKDHHPGYQRVLESMLREEGVEPSTLGY